MSGKRWIDPKWKNLKVGDRVRVKWPINKWKEGLLIDVKEKSANVELDSKGIMKLDSLESFEVQEEWF